MKAILHILFLSILFVLHVDAQISTKIKRKSIIIKKSTNSRINLSSANIDLPSPSNDSLRKIAKKIRLECNTCRKEYFGTGIEVNINIKQSANKIQIEDGHLYILTLNSLSAYGMQFHFNQYKVPVGSQLHIYSNEGIELGAFTSFNNHPDEKFATQLLPGKTFTIEYFEPHDAEFEGDLFLHRVIHSFKDFSTKRAGGGVMDLELQVRVQLTFHARKRLDTRMKSMQLH